MQPFLAPNSFWILGQESSTSLGLCQEYLADFVQRILSISTGVLEVVVGREGAVDVTRDGTVLWRLLQKEGKGWPFRMMEAHDRASAASWGSKQVLEREPHEVPEAERSGVNWSSCKKMWLH